MHVELLTTNGAAQIAKVSAQTIRNWDASGILTAQRTQNGIRLFDKTQVEQVAAERARTRR